MEIKEFFFKKIDVLMHFWLLKCSGTECQNKLWRSRIFFFKKMMENFVRKNIEMFFKGEFCC